MEENQNITNAENVEEPISDGNKKSNKILPIILGTLIGIVAVTGITFATISMTSPKNTFIRIVNNSMSSASKDLSKVENSVWGKLATVDTTKKLTIDANIGGKIKTEDEEMKTYYQGLETFDVKAKADIDLTNKYRNTNAEFLLNNEKILTGDYIKNKNIVSLKLDNITDGYITANNDDLSTLWNKVGYEGGPKSLDNCIDSLKKLDFTKKDLNNLQKVGNKFMSAFFKAFDDEDFGIGNNTSTVTYDEGTIDCNTMDFVISATDLNNGIINGLEAVVNNDFCIDAIYKGDKLLNNALGYSEQSKEDFTAGLKEYLTQVKALEISEADQGCIIRIYYKNNKIVKIDMLSEDYNTTIFSFTTVTNGNSGYYKYFDGSIVYEDKVTTVDNITTHVVATDYINAETGEKFEGYGGEVTIIIDNTSKNESNIRLVEKAKIIPYTEDETEPDINTIEPTVIKDYTLKCSIENNEKNFAISMMEGDETYSSTFSFDAKIIENAKFEVKNVNAEENFDTTTKTDEEITIKKDKVVENWNNAIGNDKIKKDSFLNGIFIFLWRFVPNSYYDYSDDYYDDDMDYSDIDYSDIDWESLGIDVAEE